MRGEGVFAREGGGGEAVLRFIAPIQSGQPNRDDVGCRDSWHLLEVGATVSTTK